MAHKMSKDIKSDSVYRDWLAKLKEKFRGVQIKAAVVTGNPVSSSPDRGINVLRDSEAYSKQQIG